ncbi:MAG: hypothetical protein UV38_C0005G0017 [candidate division TM6 bacterium GW2011_GWE2_42_60]|nr:MAG: hypothetical protein UV38_C0005G0017 [candidate division TM6 bacterium GW2011_GWE2_42_60]HBY05335.1 hypothetical protein [Candidatus Dependentiae bacterium]
MNHTPTRWIAIAFFMISALCSQNNMSGNPTEINALPLHKIIFKKNNTRACDLKKFLIPKDAEDLRRTTLQKNLSDEDKEVKKNNYQALFLESNILLKPQKKNNKNLLFLLEFMRSIAALQNLSTSQYE